MNSTNIDKAWNKLYERLEKENLLPPEKEKKQISVTFRWAAAIFLLCVAGTITLLTIQTKNNAENLLSKTNEDINNTLVTTLEDGSVVYLSGNSSLFYPENFAGNNRKVKIEGNAMFDINKQPERPFFVETEHVSVKVLGTAFRINTTKGHSLFELFVQRGKVEVTNRHSGETIFVEAGEMVQLESNHLLKSNNSDSRMFNAFTNKMSFKDERLDNILKVIQNTTETSIALSDKNLSNKTLTVTFDNNSADSMVELICLALHLNYEQKQGVIYISPN